MRTMKHLSHLSFFILLVATQNGLAQESTPSPQQTLPNGLSLFSVLPCFKVALPCSIRGPGDLPR